MAKNKNKKRLGIAAAALGLFFAVGATAGTTLAKYISSTDVKSYTTTVAQWGYTLTANANKMFGEFYDNNGNVETSKTDNSVVVSARSTDVIAPGTHGNMALSINGTAEVNAVLKINLGEKFETVVLRDAETEGELTYYPLVWTVGNKEFKDGFGAAKLLDAIKESISDHLKGQVETEEKDGVLYVYLPAGTTFSNFNLTIAWSWAFGKEGFGPSDDQYTDEKDTLLGFIAAEVEDYSELSENIQAYLFNTRKADKDSVKSILGDNEDKTFKVEEEKWEEAQETWKDAQDEYAKAVKKYQDALVEFEATKAPLAAAKAKVEKADADVKALEAEKSELEEEKQKLEEDNDGQEHQERIQAIEERLQAIGNGEGEGDLKTAKDALATAKSELGEEESATEDDTAYGNYNDAKKALDDAKKELLGEDGEGTAEGCAKKTYDDAYVQYLGDAEQYQSAVEEYTEYLEEFYGKLVDESNLTIEFEFSAAIVQTQAVSLDKFLEAIK